MKNLKYSLIVVLNLLVVISCKKDKLSDENFISSFSMQIGENNYEGIIDNKSNSIQISDVPFNTNLESINTQISVSDRAEVNPASGTSQNFTQSVSYTVTAENGEKRTYTIIIKREPNDENYITKFSISVGSNIVEGSIDNKSNTVKLNIPDKFDITSIKPDIEISTNATISPLKDQLQNFENEIEYEITSESGEKRTYSVLSTIESGLNDENSILEFRINGGTFITNATINNYDDSITQRVPQSVDLSNLNISISIPDYATITPEITNLKDFSQPVAVKVISESGIEKTYDVSIIHMDDSFSKTCGEMDASKWFGGDDRTGVPNLNPFDRNVGTGQAIILDKDLNPTSFAVHLESAFSSRINNLNANSLELKLNIRNANGEILIATKTNVSDSFNGGMITFDLENENLFLENNTKYIFQWYLINGELLGVSSGSSANSTEGRSGFCFNGGYAGQSKLSNSNSLEEFSVWFEHEWNFNIILNGKQ